MNRWKKTGILMMLLLAVGILLPGCTIKDGGDEKLRDVEFTVLSEEEIPPEFLDFIIGKQSQPFKLTYTTDEYLYIAAGYGEQTTGGYSISVKDCYMTENALVFDTELLGPSASEDSIPGASFPYIVIKVEKTDMTVIFK
ncbi:MAG: protease complex subunit PrcB family protein [Lachnospiraceae bacterium]|nr:protease complex subunit PrcB family protein [Lachnospiraceae bacterium]